MACIQYNRPVYRGLLYLIWNASKIFLLFPNLLINNDYINIFSTLNPIYRVYHTDKSHADFQLPPSEAKPTQPPKIDARAALETVARAKSSVTEGADGRGRCCDTFTTRH